MTELGLNVIEAVVASRLELPEGYVHADPSEINLDDLRELDESIRGPFTSPLQHLDWPTIGRDRYGRLNIALGVRTLDVGALIGVGFIVVESNETRAVLGDLMVHLDHRREGLGRTIIRERVMVADAIGITHLSTGELQDTNTLPTFYTELGFVQNQFYGLLRETSR